MRRFPPDTGSIEWRLTAVEKARKKEKAKQLPLGCLESKAVALKLVPGEDYWLNVRISREVFNSFHCYDNDPYVWLNLPLDSLQDLGNFIVALSARYNYQVGELNKLVAKGNSDA